MPEQVSKLFARLAGLADAEGAVPEDGSGIDGVWITIVPAIDRDRDWTVAMNADTEERHNAEDVPAEGDRTSLQPGTAMVWLGEWPAGVLNPHGGQIVVEQADAGPQSLEDELIADVDARIEEVGA
ncbi:hypothetical protein [Halolamina rubra]|uniref:hypothetical protein n=1 Tax=Halolamina rubra TaxID=1380430 RepID=UPI00067929A7|nr:hypothetical protein [Halolamina rubra]